MNINFTYKGAHIVITEYIAVNGINIGTACENTTFLQLRDMLDNYLNR